MLEKKMIVIKKFKKLRQVTRKLNYFVIVQNTTLELNINFKL